MGICRFVLSACAMFALAGPAFARTLSTEASECPVSLRAPLVIDLGSIEPGEGAASDNTDDHVLIIYAPTRAGWARQRLLSRFRVDPATMGPATTGPATVESAGSVPAPCFRRVR
ncbi:MAG: hypothetical protein KDA46_05345 [Parvularculaceae bacterium]|nr:hypothetical protein [Parvularculaceae bacterium]